MTSHERKNKVQVEHLRVKNLRKYFPVRKNFRSKKDAYVQAVDDVSFFVRKGETLGVVGESGCGKSTVARLLMTLIKPDSGEVFLDGVEVEVSNNTSRRELQRRVQMVFQDSYASLNPRLPIRDTIAFGPRAHGATKKAAREIAHDYLELVGLDAHRFGGRYPHQLSGGQRQRVNIARALALNPELVVLDEAVSALDKSIEAQVLNLLIDLKVQLGLTYIFISHDLNTVRYISDRVMVMYLGTIVEVGDVASIYSAPGHPYSQALLHAEPSMDPDRRANKAPITGDPPTPIAPPPGCRFHTRCEFAADICSIEVPSLERVSSNAGTTDQWAACHLNSKHKKHPRAAEWEKSRLLKKQPKEGHNND